MNVGGLLLLGLLLLPIVALVAAWDSNDAERAHRLQLREEDARKRAYLEDIRAIGRQTREAIIAEAMRRRAGDDR